MSFMQGHILIIGVGSHPDINNADVPTTDEDAQAVEKTMISDFRCASRSELPHYYSHRGVASICWQAMRVIQ
jgi:hypothetical protein